jgi:HD-GYP domain-containing protein (c-di-GMP phosphodiesterase class II)
VVIRRAALLHDLGKLALPEALLQKPAPLTAEEQLIVRRYPQLGSDLMARLPFMAGPAAIVRATRERLDGEGYPKRLSAPQVSLGARIVAVADAYDTMIRARVFRDAISPAAAVQELERCSGTQFDGEVVAVVKQLVASAH